MDEVRLIPVKKKRNLRNLLFQSMPSYYKIMDYDYIKNKWPNSVKICIIDNGLDYHTDITKNVLSDKDYTNEGVFGADHNTHVVGASKRM